MSYGAWRILRALVESGPIEDWQIVPGEVRRELRESRVALVRRAWNTRRDGELTVTCYGLDVYEDERAERERLN
jgi:hypothetical protein